MFTGIIQGLGRISEIRPLAGEVRLGVEAQFEWDSPVKTGESISVSGACLTVTSHKGRGFLADVSAETISRTTLKNLKLGDPVNLERALLLSDRLGGHLVSGHVDYVGVIKGRQLRDRSYIFTISAHSDYLAQFVAKGSVAVDGISLTVNEISADSFTVNIIPHTLDATTLQFKNIGDSVNIETDLIGKYVARLLTSGRIEDKINMEFLAEHGFV